MEKILEGQAVNEITKSGKIVLTNEDALNSSEPVILIKHHAMPEDTEAIIAASGIVTIVGGTLSHASIVAKEFQKACLIGCEGLSIDLHRNIIQIKNRIIPAGSEVVVDGLTGSVYLK